MVSLRTTRNAALALTMCVLAAGTLRVRAEEVTAHTPSPTPAGPADELNRGVPRTAMLGYLEAARDGDYVRAAEYLDLRRRGSNQREDKGPTLARHLKVVIDRAFWIDPDTWSDRPEGHLDDGLPPNRDVLGTINTKKERVNIVLDRVPRDDGVLIWKISTITVTRIPDLYAEFGYGPLGELLPAPLFEIGFFTIELWQWIGLFGLGCAALMAAWLTTVVVAWLARPLAARFTDNVDHQLERLILRPLRWGIAAIVFYAGSFFLALSLAVQQTLNGVFKSATIVVLTWLTLRVIDVAVLRIERRLLARGRGAAVGVLPVGRRAAKVFLIAIAALALLQNLGLNVTGLLAGLGIGGLAVALAAQETVKNFFGGLALIADQPVRIGDFCRFGNTMGTVEDISLWSTRVRTLDQTLVSIPNSQFAGMQLENFTRRDLMPLSTKFSVRAQTSADDLRSALTDLRQMLTAHPKVQHDRVRVSVVGFNGSQLEVEVFAYITTRSFKEFVGIREDLLVQIMAIVRTANREPDTSA
jgi:MscS family membrane protein